MGGGGSYKFLGDTQVDSQESSHDLPFHAKWLFEYWQFVKLERTVFTLLLGLSVVGSSLGFGQYEVGFRWLSCIFFVSRVDKLQLLHHPDRLCETRHLLWSPLQHCSSVRSNHSVIRFIRNVAGKYLDHKHAHNAYNRTRRSR